MYRIYRDELIEKMSSYRFQDKTDLFRRLESMDALYGADKTDHLEDSAALEVQNLIRQIEQDFFREFEQVKYRRCCAFIEKQVHNYARMKKIDCDPCCEGKFVKAACA